VPGIGVRNVARILRMRRWHRLRTRDLARLRVALGRALPFVVLADHTPGPLADALDIRRRMPGKEQLDLFRVAGSARTGEL
jgi:predicted DNA-binding helix-hairpin-helix protein